MTAKKAQLDSRRKALKQQVPSLFHLLVLLLFTLWLQVQLLSTDFDKCKQDLATNEFAGEIEGKRKEEDEKGGKEHA